MTELSSSLFCWTFLVKWLDVQAKYKCGSDRSSGIPIERVECSGTAHLAKEEEEEEEVWGKFNVLLRILFDEYDAKRQCKCSYVLLLARKRHDINTCNWSQPDYAYIANRKYPSQRSCKSCQSVNAKSPNDFKPTRAPKWELVNGWKNEEAAKESNLIILCIGPAAAAVACPKCYYARPPSSHAENEKDLWRRRHACRPTPVKTKPSSSFAAVDTFGSYATSAPVYTCV
jgi:hypothetical protein